MRVLSATKLAILVSASLSVIYSQVLAQAGDIPEAVLVTGPVTYADPPPPINERLTQLTNEELRAVLRGARVRIDRSDTLTVGCDGLWSGNGVGDRFYGGSYSIRDNRFCVLGPSVSNCFSFFRSEAGSLFSDIYKFGHVGLRQVEISPPFSDRACLRR